MTKEKSFIVGEVEILIANTFPSIQKGKKIYQSYGLVKHIQKRHPECVAYIEYIPDIISEPHYIGINPNEKGISFELVRTYTDNVQIGIKLDYRENYLYVATLHTITKSKLQYRINNGRLKKLTKSNK